MTSTLHHESLRTLATTGAQAATPPGGYPNFHPEEMERSPAKLRPGAALTFAIAAVVAVLSFIEILFS